MYTNLYLFSITLMDIAKINSRQIRVDNNQDQIK